MKKLLPLLVLTLFASATLAEPPAPSAAEQLVKQEVLAPLQKIEGKRSKFSRAMVVPVQRRVRVLDAVVETDARGKQFVRFAIDVRRGFLEEAATWESDAIVGCAYPKEREVFVRRDDAYYPASVVLGRDAREQRGACQAAGDLALTAGHSRTRS